MRERNAGGTPGTPGAIGTTGTTGTTPGATRFRGANPVGFADPARSTCLVSQHAPRSGAERGFASG